MVEKSEILDDVIHRIDAMDELAALFGIMDAETLRQLSSATREVVREHNKAILYKSRPFEKFQDNALFGDLKHAILQRHYLDIYDYEKQVPELEEYRDKDYYQVMPLKIIYMENNWYLAGVVYVNDRYYVRFFRLRFIGDYKILEKHFETKEIDERYFEFLSSFKTLFSRYGVPHKYALLKVSAKVASYFESKEQFPGQGMLQFNDDGSAMFTVHYTQTQEILPLIKKWIPDVTIIESEDPQLQEVLKRELETLLQTLS